MRAVLAACAIIAVGGPAGSPMTVAKPHEVTIFGLDYAFSIPRELPPGSTTFRFSNKGKVRHEFNIFLLKPGAKIEDVVALRKQGKSTLTLIDGTVGVLFASPGGRSAAGMATDLMAGRDYGVICIFRDAANGSPPSGNGNVHGDSRRTGNDPSCH